VCQLPQRGAKDVSNSSSTALNVPADGGVKIARLENWKKEQLVPGSTAV